MSNGTVSFAGNLTDDPELRFTPKGTAVCNMSVAVNENYRDAQGKWQDRLMGFFTVTVWRQAAENCAEVLRKGDRVTVLGTLRNRSYEDKEGNKRWVTEVQAEDVGKSLTWLHKEKERAANSAAQSDEPEDVPF